MLQHLAYLHDSELVARFQRRCGLVLVECGGRAPRGREPPAGPPRDAAADPRDGKSEDKENGSAESDLYEVRNRPLAEVRNRPLYEVRNRPLEEVRNRPLEEVRNRPLYEVRNRPLEEVRNRPLEEVRNRPLYEVRNRPLHFLFLLSAGLGHELFYITCLPCVHWSLDPFLCRRLVNMWTLVMYVGQVMKDVLKLPRPLSPPVVKLEPRVDAEYGLPSTHAMAATAISFTVLLSAPSRIQFQFEVGLLIALTLSSLVCLSRLYTGMHSVLDVLCGALISASILFLTFPYWEAFDRLQLTSPVSPVAALSLPLLLSYTYPAPDGRSTTRGDTTTILGAAAGSSVGYWANERLGRTFEPPLARLPVALSAPTAGALAAGAARFMVGAAALLATRQAAKTLSLRALQAWYRVPERDAERARRRREIEVPYKFVTYTAVGLVNSMVVSRVFALLGIL